MRGNVHSQYFNYLQQLRRIAVKCKKCTHRATTTMQLTKISGKEGGRNAARSQCAKRPTRVTRSISPQIKSTWCCYIDARTYIPPKRTLTIHTYIPACTDQSSGVRTRAWWSEGERAFHVWARARNDSRLSGPIDTDARAMIALPALLSLSLPLSVIFLPSPSRQKYKTAREIAPRRS